MALSANGAERFRGASLVPDPLGRRPVRAVRRRAVRPGAGRFGAVVEPGAGVPPLPRQPLQGAGQRPGRGGPAAPAAGRHPPGDWPLVFAVDASTWDRCDAETSPERGFYYSASKHSAGQPIVAGWSYQWITQLDWAPDSWTAPLDASASRPPRTPRPPPSTRSAAWSTCSATTARCRCSSSTPATTRSPWAPHWPTPGPRSCADPRRPGLLRRSRPPPGRHRRAAPPARAPVRPVPTRHLAQPRHRTRHRRPPLRQHPRARLAGLHPKLPAVAAGPATTAHRS